MNRGSADDAGLRFYRDRLFETDGAPRFMHDRKYPFDIHGAAQGIITFALAQITRYTALYLVPIYFLLALGFYYPSIRELLRAKRPESVEMILTPLSLTPLS